MAHIGPAVRARREQLGWTIQRLATFAEVDPSYISRLEAGKVGYTPDTEEKLAYLLNTTVAAFHGGLRPETAPPDAHPAHRSIPVIPYERAISVLSGDWSYAAE